MASSHIWSGHNFLLIHSNPNLHVEPRSNEIDTANFLGFPPDFWRLLIIQCSNLELETMHERPRVGQLSILKAEQPLSRSLLR